MSPLSIHSYLVIGAILFILGMIGFLARRNLIVMFLCAEMMLQGVAINLVAFARYRGNLQGQAFVLFIVTVAACEAGIALALILMLFKPPRIARRQPVAGAARVRLGSDRGHRTTDPAAAASAVAPLDPRRQGTCPRSGEESCLSCVTTSG